MSQATASPERSRPSVDPRFRRRWAEARRAEARRRLRVLVSLLVVVAVAAGGFGLLHSAVFRVRHVVIDGNLRTPRSEVMAAAGLLQAGRSTLMLDAGSATARRAVQALPWVSTAVFSRHWPWTIVITVKERAPAAWLSSGRSTEVIDPTGRALYISSAAHPPVPGLPAISGARLASPGQQVLPGPGLSRQELAEILAAAAVSPRSLATRGLQYAYSPALGLVAYVGPQRVLVLLGGPDEMATKLAVLEELASRVGLSEYSEVDLSVPERPALTPQASPNNA